MALGNRVVKSNSQTWLKENGGLVEVTENLARRLNSYFWRKRKSCHLWVGVTLLKLQKRICKTDGPSLAASLEPLAYHQNVASSSLFCRYYLIGE